MEGIQDGEKALGYFAINLKHARNVFERKRNGTEHYPSHVETAASKLGKEWRAQQKPKGKSKRS